MINTDNFPPKQSKSPTEVALDIIDNQPSQFDPLGMYTGVSSVDDEPRQDEDDL